MKVLYHINDNGKWKMVLGNVRNMIETGKELGESFVIEVVANGDAVFNLQGDIVKDPKINKELKLLFGEGVTFVACNNSLKKLAIDANKLIQFVKIVPAGVIEIARKQQEGYSYIKP